MGGANYKIELYSCHIVFVHSDFTALSETDKLIPYSSTHDYDINSEC